jgi:hypothetical protein
MTIDGSIRVYRPRPPSAITAEPSRPAARAATRGLVVLANSKATGDELLSRLRLSTPMFRKPSASGPAEESVLRQVSEKGDRALVLLGD